MVTDEAYNSINRYFSTLTHTGYMPDTDVNKLIVFLFMEELLYGPLSEYINEEDYGTINRSAECLYGTCMIPYPDYKRSYDSVVHRMPDMYRITESDILRSLESDMLRIKS